MAEFNPFDPRLLTDPHSVYRELREHDPVHWSPLMQVWLLTRYEDCVAVLRDHAVFSSDRTRSSNFLVQQMEAFRQTIGPVASTQTVLSSDPPDHTRMRKLINKAFTPGVVERSRPHIRDIAESLLDALPDAGHIDVVRDLAVPLPIIVIAEILGVPAADREQFKAWSNDIAGTLSGGAPAPEALERARRASIELTDYFSVQIEERRRRPRQDLMSALVAAEEQGDLLTHEELLATCILLLVAGNETTTNLIGSGMLTLLQHPEQLRLLQQRPELIPAAVEEMLRYEGPAQMTSRVAVRPAMLGGKQIEPGQVVLVVLGAANRDPAQFPDPDRFDVRRHPNRHLAFGLGIHYCLGAPLAVAEAQIAFESLLRRLPEPAAAFEAPDWGNSFILRGLRSLPLRTGAAVSA
jgi:pimeloyl-[acyl-carrier protein] synthase